MKGIQSSKVALICPVCEKKLKWGSRRVYCPKRHSFDLSQEGYVNLLLTNQRSSKQPGDSREMLKSRRVFLEGGFYSPLSSVINCAVEVFLDSEDNTGEVRILDVGCGEGYYLGTLYDYIGQIKSNFIRSFYGFDISKVAIRMAARKYKELRWGVANLAHKIPFAEDSFDIVLSVFAPRNVNEFSRILRRNGLVVVIVPGEEHLVELREQVMDFAQDYGYKEAVEIMRFSNAFILKKRKYLRYKMCLNQKMLLDLLHMTPIYWKSSRSAIAQVEQLESLNVTASFVLLLFTH